MFIIDYQYIYVMNKILFCYIISFWRLLEWSIIYVHDGWWLWQIVALHWFSMLCTIVFPSIMFSVSGQKNINQVWDQLNTGSTNAQVTLRNAINQLLSWPQSTHSHRQHFSSQCAQLIAIASDSCFLFRFWFVFNNRFFGSNQVEWGTPNSKNRPFY